jgi:DNA-binding NarL/FixJ family response regulator
MISTGKSLDDKERRIISLIRNGRTIKEISPLVYLSPSAIGYRLRELKKHYKADSTHHLITILITEAQIE